MTSNLNLAGGTTITNSDSNITAASYTLPSSRTSGFDSNITANVYNSNSITCGDDSPCYSYYNYIAATAGTSPSSGNASSDICPKNWRLPTRAELTTLKNSYTTGTTLTASPFLGVYSGYYSYDSLYYGGSFGPYWSSTAYDSFSAYRLGYDSSSANVSSNDKNSGFSIRCVAKS